MKLSLSKASLPLYCAWPFADDREPPAVVFSGERYRLLGQAFHGVVASLINEGEYDVVAQVEALAIPGDLQENVAAVVQMFPMDAAMAVKQAHPLARAEVAFALNPATKKARELGVNIGREYTKHGLLEGEHGGTADIMWIEEGPDRKSDVIVIQDWKVVFGKGAHVPHPRENHQLRSLAFAAMLAYCAKRARIQVCVVDDMGDSYLMEAELSLFEALVDMRKIMAAVATANTAVPNPGRHCIDHYCPMLPICPSVQANVSGAYKLLPHPDLERMPIVIDVKKIQSDAHAAYLVTVAKQVDRVAALVLKTCQEYVRLKGAPIPMGEDSVWGPFHQSRTAVTASAVDPLVGVIAPFVGGEAVARQIVKAGVSKTALTREIAAHSPKGMGKANAKECIRLLSEQGMVAVVHEGERFDERKRRGSE